MLFHGILEIVTELPKQQGRNIGDWMRSLTEEQRQLFYARRRDTVQALAAQRRALSVTRYHAKVDATASQTYKEAKGNGPDWTPSTELLLMVWEMIDLGIPLERLQEALARLNMGSQVMMRLKKFVFSESISSTEDVGLRLLASIRYSIAAAKTEYESMKMLQKKKPFSFQREILQCLALIADLEKDLARELSNLGLVSARKHGGGGIHVHISTPRPDQTVISDGTATVDAKGVPVEDGNYRRLPSDPVAEEIPSVPRPTQSAPRSTGLHEGGHSALDECGSSPDAGDHSVD